MNQLECNIYNDVDILHSQQLEIKIQWLGIVVGTMYHVGYCMKPVKFLSPVTFAVILLCVPPLDFVYCILMKHSMLWNMEHSQRFLIAFRQ